MSLFGHSYMRFLRFLWNCSVFYEIFYACILAYASRRLRLTVSGDTYRCCPTSTQERFFTSHSMMQNCSCGGSSNSCTYAAACLGGIFCSFCRNARCLSSIAFPYAVNLWDARVVATHGGAGGSSSRVPVQLCFSLLTSICIPLPTPALAGCSLSRSTCTFLPVPARGVCSAPA